VKKERKGTCIKCCTHGGYHVGFRDLEPAVEKEQEARHVLGVLHALSHCSESVT
jgi:hypothetical protein